MNSQPEPKPRPQRPPGQADEAQLNIGAVARMTEIPEATLRVWERRYGFPQAERTPGGHRLYSHAEVGRLRWVKARMEEGMQVNHAVRALQRAETEGEFSPRIWPVQIVDRGEPGSEFGVALQHSLQARLMQALLAHEVEEANEVIGEAHGYCNMEEIILNILLPTFNAIGAAWERGEIDVATEHLATNHLRHHLLLCIRLGPPPFDVRPIVLACAPGELHEGGLLMIGALLRRLRWPVLYLGQTLPLGDLPALVDDLHPSVVVLVAMTESPARALGELGELPLHGDASAPPTVIAFGGRAFVENPALVARVQGHYLGDTIEAGVRELDGVMHQMHPRLH